MNIFLIDSLGAFLSSLFSMILVTYFEEKIGMPAGVLYSLAVMAFAYSLYSLFCFLTNKEALFLKVILIANALYFLLVIGLIFLFYQNLTTLGLIYFVLESVVMGSLIVYEWLTYSRFKY